MDDLRWWRFWEAAQWREWWSRRAPWREHQNKAKSGELDPAAPRPPRPISPAWVPAALLTVLAAASTSPGDAGTPGTPTATPSPTITTAAAQDTSMATTTSMVTTTSMSTTNSTVPRSTTNPTPPDPLLAPVSAGPSGDPAAPPPQGSTHATVLVIVDGDTVDVRLDSGEEDVVRLIGVNSPESGECFAAEATRVLGRLIPRRSAVAMTVDESERDQFDRLLRYLWIGGMSVNQELVRRGAAIARRYAPDTAMAEELEAAQEAAQAAGLGLWAPDACGPAAGDTVRIVELNYDAPGDDNHNLNEEWITVRNEGASFVDLTGWTLKDESASHRYAFPASFGLVPGETATLHTGCGDDFGTTLFWCNEGSAVWNNDGDTAFLLDSSGNVHHTSGY